MAETEDSFDAAISARQMALHAAEFADLDAPGHQDRVEGRIWLPKARFEHPAISASLSQRDGPGAGIPPYHPLRSATRSRQN